MLFQRPISHNLRLWVFICLIFIIFSPYEAFASSTPSTAIERMFIRDNVLECSDKFSDVMDNPSALGGIEIISKKRGILNNNIIILCLYGSLENFTKSHEKKRKLLNILERYEYFDYLYLNSTGGDVDTWLSISESLYGKVGAVIVDTICISSCANYPFFLSNQKYVLNNSLVIWHGGPVVQNLNDKLILGINEENPNEYVRNLAIRTSKFYAKYGISPKLLEDTSKNDLGVVENLFFKKNFFQVPPKFSGYALNRSVLRNCYNVKGINDKNMWYPTSYKNLYALANSRSNNLRPLQSPKILDNHPCRTGNKKITSEIKKIKGSGGFIHKKSKRYDNLEIGVSGKEISRHIFKKGDTIFSIASSLCVDPIAIMKLNDIKDTTLIIENSIIDLPAKNC